MRTGKLTNFKIATWKSKHYSLHRNNVQSVCSIFSFFLSGLCDFKANQTNQCIFLYKPLRAQYDLNSVMFA